MDESVDFVKATAGEVKEFMSWENHKSSVQHRKIFKAHPGQQRMPAVSELRLSDNQFLFKKPAVSLDDSYPCPASNPLCTPQCYPGTSSSESSVASADTVTLRQSTKVFVENHTPNGHSKNPVHAVCLTSNKPRPGRSLYLESRKTPSGTLDTVVGKSNQHQHVSAYEKSFPIKPTSSPSWGSSYRRSPKKAQRRCISTAEETVREDEKEIYRQLLQVVTGKSFLTTRTPSLFPSHLPRSVDSSNHLPKPTVSATKTKSAEACIAPACPAASVTHTHIPPSPSPSLPFPFSYCSTNDSTYYGSRLTSTPHRQQNNVIPPDTLCEGSNSVIEIDDDVKTPETPNAPFFQAELWIKELTSLYDSRARERSRQIEEQKALALQLQSQRLQEHSVQEAVDLHLRVPLEKEIPVVQEQKVPVKIPVEVEFPELNQEMLKEIRRAFIGGNQDEILSEAFRLTITRKDILTLNNLNWLNDEIINFYMNLLMERSKRKGLPNVHAFNTFFFTKVKSAGYHAVKRWTKKIDLFSVDVILVPIHLGVHWCLAAVDFRKKCITYYDSMGGNNIEACKILLQYLKQESLDKKGRDFDTNGWQLICKRNQEIPQQMNGSDCGMFACKYADYITKDKPITFTQQHMPYFRKRMVWEILHQKLL